MQEFVTFCRALVNVNFKRAVAAAEGEWLPLMVGGPSADERSYMELQPSFEEHGKDAVVEAWAPIQVQVEGWTEAALIMAAWFAPITDAGPRPSEHPKRSEVVYLIAFGRGRQREAFKAPIIRLTGREPRLGRWFRLPDGLEAKGMEAMQAAVDGDLALQYVEESVEAQ